ncbi:MAG: 30S ribosomal protein S11 [Candidatus Diapherotrites archaeon]|nr:30S ribosomal protein S11 [Candidatus Diapherotrites archaeon]
MQNNTAVIHIYASRNNTIMVLTDQTGAETIATSSGGRVVKAQHKEGSPYAAMKVAEIISQVAKEKGIFEVEVRVRGQGGIRPKNPGQGAEAAIISLTRNGLRIKSIQNVTPLPHNGTRRKKRHRSKKK